MAPVMPVGARETRLLSEAEGKALLAKAGVAVPRGVTGGNTCGSSGKSASLDAPLALKGLGFAHKTEAGGVCTVGLVSLDGQAEMPGATAIWQKKWSPAPWQNHRWGAP